jgi:phosphinothricin acetyltransferase
VTPIRIRRAVSTDAEAIARVYNHYIRTSTSTFDTEPKTAEERASWIVGRSAAHPVFVAEQDGHLVAWGALSPWGERPAYQHSVEISTYVDAEDTRKGVGPELATALISEPHRRRERTFAEDERPAGIL